MLHVKQIQILADQGESDQAHDALEQLLALGPNNVEALKIKARLLGFEGRFRDEGRLWEKIATIDRDDLDALNYLQQRQIEEREHFYFTDDLPGGGRKFLAYPKGLINMSMIGLIGCVCFLLTTRLSQSFPIFADPSVMLGLFGFFVLFPWIGILTSYFRGLKAISVNSHIFSVSTRIRSYNLRWNQVEKIYLAYTYLGKHPGLSLLLIPKTSDSPALEIDLSRESTALRARTFLVSEITRFFAAPEHQKREKIALSSFKIKKI